MGKERSTKQGDLFFEELEKTLSGAGNRALDGPGITRGIRSIAEDAVKEAQQVQASLLKSQRTHRNKLQVLGRWKVKSQAWGFLGLAAAAGNQIEVLKRVQAAMIKAEGTIRVQKNKPYGRALEWITWILEQQNVGYAPYLAACVLYHAGFEGIGDVIVPPKKPLTLYKVGGSGLLQPHNGAAQRRLQLFEKAWLRYLKETHRTLSSKDHPRANQADFFRLQIIEEERRQGLSRKQRPPSKRTERIRQALPRQEARNRGQQVAVEEEEYLRRKVYHQTMKDLQEKYGIGFAGAWWDEIGHNSS